VSLFTSAQRIDNNCFLSVCILPMINSKNVYDFFLLIQSVEYSEFSNAVSPGVRDVLSQFFDVFSEKWFQLDLGVNLRGELFLNKGFVLRVKFFNPLQELSRFKNTIFIQRNALFVLLHL
jgi:hypothetical protein